MIWTGTLSCLNTLMEDKKPVKKTGRYKMGQKTQTLIFTHGQFVNADMGMCGVIQQAEVVVEGRNLQCHLNTLGLFHLSEIDR